MAGEASSHTLNANQKVLQYFWDLASLDEKERRAAVQVLLAELKRGSATAEATPHTGSTSTEADANSADAILTQCPPVVGYCLRRLIRGLASGRQGARQGFATALAALLAGQLPGLGAADIVALIDHLLAPRHSSMSKTEVSDVLTGRLFGYGALVRSHLQLDTATAVMVAEEVVAVGESRSFLTEASTSLLLELLPGKLDTQGIAAVVAAEKGPGSWLQASLEQARPESLVLALRLWAHLPPDTLAACKLLPSSCPALPSSFWTSPGSVPREVVEGVTAAVFAPAYLQSVLPVLLRTEQSHPRLHSVWITLLQLLLPGFRAKQAADGEATDAAPAAPALIPPVAAHLETFWHVAVDGGLLQGKSPLRQFAALRLLKLALPYLAPSNVHVLLGRPLLALLGSNLKSADHLLHVKARHIVAQLQGLLQREALDESVKMAILSALSTLGFAKLTSKAAKQQGVDASAVASHVERMIATFVAAPEAGTAADPPRKKQRLEEQTAGPQDNEEAADDSRRSWAVEQLAAVLRNPQAGPGERLAALRFMATVAFFSVKNAKKAGSSKYPEVQQLAACQPPPSRQLQQQCAARLVSLVSAAMRQHTPGNRKGKGPDANGPQAANGTPATQQAAGEPAADGAAEQKDVVKSLVAFVGKLQSSPALQLSQPLDDRQAAALDALKALQQALVAQITVAPQGATRARALLQLVQLLHLYLLSEPSSVEADLPLDLRMVAEKGLGVQLPEGAQGEDEDQEEEGDAEADGGPGSRAGWADVLVDVLLSLLARPSEPLPSAPLRDCAEALFRSCCADLTLTGLQDMVRVVGRTLGAKAQEQEDEDIFDDEEEEEEEEGGESSDEDAEEGDGDEEAGNGDRVGTGAEADGDDSGSGEEEEEEMDVDDDLDDEAMFRIDGQLAAYLRNMVDSRQNGKEQAVALLNFKLRVLALLEVFMRKVPSSPLLLPLAAPLLLALSRASHQPGDLSKRLAAVTESLSHTKPSMQGASAEDVKAALKRALYHATRDRSPVVNKAACRLLEWLLRACAKEGGELLEAASGSYRKAVEHFFHNRNTRMPLAVLKGIQAALPAVAMPSLAVILAEAANGRNALKQVEALGLAAEAMKRPAALEAAKASAPALRAALQHAIEGPFDRLSRHSEALTQAVQVVKMMRQTAGATRLAQLIGGENLNALAKSIKAVQGVELFSSGKMKGQLDNLIARLDVAKLLEVTNADATRAARLQASYTEKYSAEPAQKQPHNQKVDKAKGEPQKKDKSKQPKQTAKSKQQQQPGTIRSEVEATASAAGKRKPHGAEADAEPSATKKHKTAGANGQLDAAHPAVSPGSKRKEKTRKAKPQDSAEQQAPSLAWQEVPAKKQKTRKSHSTAHEAGAKNMDSVASETAEGVKSSGKKRKGNHGDSQMS